MPRRPLGAVVTLVVLFLIWIVSGSCGGGPATPTQPSQPGVPPSPPAGSFSMEATDDEPSEYAWAELSSLFANFAAESLTYAFNAQGSPGAPQGFLWSPFSANTAVTSPRQVLTWTSSYWCCQGAGSQYVSVEGRITAIVSDSGDIMVEETMTSAFQLSWGPSESTSTVELSPEGLRVTSRLVNRNGELDPIQELRLEGRLTYWFEAGVQKIARINVVLGYRDFPNDRPRAMGPIGPMEPAGRQLPTTSPQRCSRPLEGCTCIPNCTGTAPCAGWPAC